MVTSFVTIIREMGVFKTVKTLVMFMLLSGSFLALGLLSDLDVVKSEVKILAYVFCFMYGRLIVC